ncbi:MAG: hypothetical protein OEX00_07905 [Gammaproteobacteria bacterium]|nr:hypothetical protein [Gammaproteobacteria bacterium]MDH5691696.1 hypothetical protein [Gammaproteobacteria bacterium]
MLSRSYPLIAREGWGILGLLFAIAAIALFIGYRELAIGVVPIIAVVGFLYRDIKRKTPPRPMGVVSPVDGTVTRIEKDVLDPIRALPSTHVKIRLHALGGYAIHCPLEGKIAKMDSVAIERPGIINAFLVSTDEGDDIVVALVGGARSVPRLYLQPGHRIAHGQRVGFYFMGMEADVYVLGSSRVEIKTGARVSAGETILTTVTHKETVTGVSGQLI